MIATSLAVLGTGVMLVIVRVRSGPQPFLREASFIRWFGGIVLHVLAHLARLTRFRP